MISRMHDRLGTAGLIVAIVALVAAVGGSAFAASKNAPLTGKQKKEVEGIAKKYAGKPGTNGTNGSNGSNGAQGAKGDKGDPGAPGAAGAPGAPGAAGESPKGTDFTGTKGKCTNGGVEYKGATTNLVCNGKDGSSSPTQTGTWAVLSPGEALVPLTWSTPLADGIAGTNVHIVNGAPTADCPGSASEPQAEPGHLCVYVATIAFGATPEIVGPFRGDATQAEAFENEEEGASPSGAFLYVRGGVEAGLWGTFAVTAP